jgi:hypothetical protein
MFRNTTFVRATLAVALFGAVVLTCLAAPPAARLTIADGPVQVLRGAAKFDAVEGQALAAEDIVRTGGAARVARIEFADGRVLDLGPATQVLLLPPPPLDGSAAVLALGWAKLGAGSEGVARLAAPQLKVEAGGSTLVHAQADGAVLVFAESRAARVMARLAPIAAATLREGESWTREAGVHRALPSGVPRALADALPRRAARFDGFDAAPDGAEPLDAADLAPWLRAEPALLAQLRPRLAAMARRSAVAAPAREVRAQAPVRNARPDPRKVRPPVFAVLRSHTLPLKSVALDELQPLPSSLPLLPAERVALSTVGALPALAELPPPGAVPAAAPAASAPARSAKKRLN